MHKNTYKGLVNKLPLILLMALTIYFLGYFRNFLFVSINAQSSSIYYKDTTPTLPAFMSFISGKSYLYLIRLKWILTFLFSLSFCLSSMLFIRIFFTERIYLKICLIFYAFMMFASLFMMALGYIIPSFSVHAFNISRNLMHITQSPFTVLLLFAIAFYHKEGSPQV